MVIAVLTLQLHFPESGSLKDKRLVLRSLMDRLQNRFNVSVAEVEDRDLWQSSVLVLAHVNTGRPDAESTLQAVLNLVDAESSVQVVDAQTEFL
jgi:hypothetical protein